MALVVHRQAAHIILRGAEADQVVKTLTILPLTPLMGLQEFSSTTLNSSAERGGLVVVVLVVEVALPQPLVMALTEQSELSGPD